MSTNTVRILKSTINEDEQGLEEAYKRDIQIWILRILIDLKVYRRVGSSFNIDATTISNIVELELEPGEEAADAIVPVRLEKRLGELDAKKSEHGCVFTRNLKKLSNVLGLTDAEELVLEFLLIAHKDRELGDTLDLIGDGLTIGEVVSALSIILNISEEKIRHALAPGGGLFSAGLVRLDPALLSIRDKVRIFTRLLDAVSLPQDTPLGILEHFLNRAPTPQLSTSDFEDYKSDYSLLKQYLEASISQNSVGCNILLYGQPGVGKTQLVRTLCYELGVALFEIASEDHDGDSLSTAARLSAYQLSQKLLARREQTVLLFDEVEGIFPQNHFDWAPSRGTGSAQKSWINRQLEENILPVFWLTNDVSQMDPASIRRFDIVLELQPMSTKARLALLERKCQETGIGSGSWTRKAAQNQHLSPALIGNFTKVIARAKQNKDGSEAELFEKLANETFSAMGLPKLSIQEKQSELPYKVDFLNADTDLRVLIDGLRRNRDGRVLCYGPPGTGKTAFAQYLASALEQTLFQFRASDILGPYVGMTERNLAQAFHRAKAEDAVMLLDEIDSLLRSREGATHSWEVTQVNELLVQMETFPGVLIACTNHKSSLDSAAARRFDLKVSLNYLKDSHAWDLFRAVLKMYRSSLVGCKQDVRYRLSRLEYLTPGDFKAAVRRLSITKEKIKARDLIEALESEVNAKGYSKSRGIGFSAVI